jgi:uncharacterized OB-fold protein
MIKGALTLPRDEYWFNTGAAIVRGHGEQITGKLQKCAKCGCLYQEKQYDCPNCHYSSGGD